MDEVDWGCIGGFRHRSVCVSACLLTTLDYRQQVHRRGFCIFNGVDLGDMRGLNLLVTRSIF